MKEDAMIFLRELADELGTTTEYLWSVLVNQGPISGVVSIITFLMLLITSVALMFLAKKEIESGHEGWAVLSSLTAIVSVLVTLIYGVTALKTGVYGLVNPEYWALLHLSNIR